MLITFFLVWSTAMILLPSGISIVRRSFFTTGKVTMETFAPVSKTALIGIPLILTVVRIVHFISFLSGEVYLISSLIPLIPATASSVVVVIAVKISLEPSSRILLEPFRHTVLLEV